MAAKQPALITFISEVQFKIYRFWVRFILVVVVLAALGGMTYRIYTGTPFPYWLLLYSVFVYQFYYFTRKLKKVEFDTEFLYISEKGYEVVIPLENIKDVEIQSLGGIYKITLHDAIQSGKEMFFKPSLIYPFDYRKQDEKVNVMWKYIEKAKQKPQFIQRNALHS